MQHHVLEAILKSLRCPKYKHFKSMLNAENYSSITLSFYLRYSSHTFCIEIDREKRCIYCLHNFNIHCIEDEYHVLYNCFQYSDVRKRFLYSWYVGRSNYDNLHTLMITTDEMTTRTSVVFNAAAMNMKD